jgi:hypothetical protein
VDAAQRVAVSGAKRGLACAVVAKLGASSARFGSSLVLARCGIAALAACALRACSKLAALAASAVGSSAFTLARLSCFDDSVAAFWCIRLEVLAVDVVVDFCAHLRLAVLGIELVNVVEETISVVHNTSRASLAFFK